MIGCDDGVYFEYEPEDEAFVNSVFQFGRYEGLKTGYSEIVNRISEAEKVGIDPENMFQHLKDFSLENVFLYDRLLTGLKTRMDDEH